jgi:hypothetical protein
MGFIVLSLGCGGLPPIIPVNRTTAGGAIEAGYDGIGADCRSRNEILPFTDIARILASVVTKSSV